MYISTKTYSTDIKINHKTIELVSTDRDFQYKITGKYEINNTGILNIKEFRFNFVHKFKEFNDFKIIIDNKIIKIVCATNRWIDKYDIMFKFSNINTKQKINISLYNFPLSAFVPSVENSIKFELSPKKFMLHYRSPYSMDDSMVEILKHNVLNSEYITDLKSGKIISFDSISNIMTKLQELSLDIFKMSDYQIHTFRIERSITEMFENFDTAKLLSFNNPI